MIQLGYTDNKKKSAYVAIDVSWHEFQKIRVIAGNMFIKTLSFGGSAISRQDTDFVYYIVISHRGRGIITKQELNDATIATQAVIRTLRSFS